MIPLRKPSQRYYHPQDPEKPSEEELDRMEELEQEAEDNWMPPESYYDDHED